MIDRRNMVTQLAALPVAGLLTTGMAAPKRPTVGEIAPDFSLKLLDDNARVIGFARFVGLLTNRAMRMRPSSLAVLATRRGRVMEAVGTEPGSHTHKLALEAYDCLPLEFLLPAQPPESLPLSLRQRVELFRYRGRVVLHDEEIFEEPDWACAFLGLGERPQLHSILTQQTSEDEALAQVAKIARVMRDAVQKLPPHQAYLQRYLA